MSRSLQADYKETYLFPPAVEDWIGQEHPVRFLREVVEHLDLKKLGFEKREIDAGQGRAPYSTDLLLKAWLYGYVNGIRSSRKLERACRDHLSLIWLLGRYEPDHNTLWRFWRENRKALRRVFKQVISIALKADLVGMVLHALDGTKIQAVASVEKGLHLGSLKKKLSVLEPLIKELEEEIAKGDQQGSQYRLPEELSQAKELREKVTTAMKELSEAEASHLSQSEPEAQMMKCDGKKRFAYNAQTVVDESSGMLVSEEVVTEVNDMKQLVPMMEKTEQTVGSTAQDTVADKGYRSQQQMGEAEAQGYSVLVSLWANEGSKAGKYHMSRFEYDAAQDCCWCPRGKKLEFEKETKSRHKGDWKERIYRCPHTGSCPEATLCSQDKQGRKITVTPYHEAMARQRIRQQDPGNRQKLGKNRLAVERVFGEIKANQGFRRWTYRTLEGAQTQWAVVCTAYNLRKLYLIWRSRGLILAS
jgi:transposase